VVDNEPQDSNQQALHPQRQPQFRHLLPSIVISLVCLVYVFWLARPGQIVRVLQEANYLWVMLGVFSSIAWLMVRAQVWRQLLRARPTYTQAFFTTSEGYLLNNLLPFRLGEVARSLLMAEKINLSFWEVFSTIIVERLLDIIFSVSLLAITLFFVLGMQFAWLAASSIVLIIIVSLGIIYLLARQRTQVVARVESITRRWPSFSYTISRFLLALLTGFAVITESGRFIQVLLWMVINLAIAILQYYCVLRAFIPGANMLYASVTLGVSALSSAVPSLPGAIGVMEFVMVAALSIIALPKAEVLTIGLTIRAIGYLISGIFGTIGLAKDGETLSSLYHKARNIRLRPAIGSRNEY
jgi:glycosyltransferase 2 family protein